MKEDVEFMKMGRARTTRRKRFVFRTTAGHEAAFILPRPYCECSEQTLSKALCQVTASLLWKHWIGVHVFWLHRNKDCEDCVLSGSPHGGRKEHPRRGRVLQQQGWHRSLGIRPAASVVQETDPRTFLAMCLQLKADDIWAVVPLSPFLGITEPLNLFLQRMYMIGNLLRCD